MHGILLIDKPVGWTSFDVVAKVRGGLKRSGTAKPKVGHSGTLDPLATGLLVLLIGDYCKRAPEFSKLDKTYEVVMKLGENSTTGDGEGNKQHVSNKVPPKSEILAALVTFTGEIQQTPPVYSAIKVGGQRAYKLARAGKAVALKPRPANVYRLELTGYDYPHAAFTAEVSSGTYIRSLVEDIGRQLGTGAYMTALRRTMVGPYEVQEASPIDRMPPDMSKLQPRLA